MTTTRTTNYKLNKLRDQARIPNSHYPLKAWYNTLIELIRSAQLEHQIGNNSQAFVLWLRAAGVADILSKHPELRSRRDQLSSQITTFLSTNVPLIIESAGTLEAILRSELDFSYQSDDDYNRPSTSNNYADNWEVIPSAIPNNTSIETIDPHKLYKYLSSTTFGDLATLLLDCRPLDDYKRRRINLHPPGGKGRAGVVWIDPHSLTPDLTPATLERIVKSSSSRGHSVFQKRSLFECVVIFDNDSGATIPPTLTRLADNLHDLQHPPVVLKGGFQAYEKLIGDVGVEDTGSSSNSRKRFEVPTPELLANAGRSVSAAPDIGKRNSSVLMSSQQSPSYQSNQSIDYLSYQPPPQPASQVLVTDRSQLPTPPIPSRRPPHTRRRSDQVDTEPYSGYRPRLSIDYPSISKDQSIMRTSTSTPKLPPPTAQPLSPATNGGLQFNYPTQNTQEAVKNQQHLFKASYWHGDVTGLTGLKNLGNTCYMNSTLQCLSATIPFARFFTSGVWRRFVNHNNKMGMQGRLAESFSQILTHMWREQYTFISPMTFRKNICTFANQFIGTDQHDAQEFLSFLLDGLHEDLMVGEGQKPTEDTNNDALESLPTPLGSEREWKRYKQMNDSVIVDYFQGQFRNRMECMSCHKTSTTYNSFMYLSLPVPTKKLKGSVSLTTCLDSFLKDEVMEKDNAWNCPNCKVARKSIKRLSIARLPPILLIQLKRFSFNGPFSDKIETLVTYPLKNFNLTPYTPHMANQYYGITNKDDPTLQHPPFIYELYGVTNHYGSLQSGHYTANVNSGNEWYNCADSRVSKSNEKEVVSKHGYMLYYKRVPMGR
ncbi:cysteine proteinase [Wallemia mellicola]|uniref:Ubiquitin carboxyl-terminal hydrolase n=1 Tax=Wallemia mellicola TaxID=1708541 RepID=A0A4T0NGE6_9BASI|nr:cysteine proteinase [Wallemia mellicola]